MPEQKRKQEEKQIYVIVISYSDYVEARENPSERMIYVDEFPKNIDELRSEAESEGKFYALNTPILTEKEWMDEQGIMEIVLPAGEIPKDAVLGEGKYKFIQLMDESEAQEKMQATKEIQEIKFPELYKRG